jgi:hypothetical protein
MTKVDLAAVWKAMSNDRVVIEARSAWQQLRERAAAGEPVPLLVEMRKLGHRVAKHFQAGKVVGKETEQTVLLLLVGPSLRGASPLPHSQHTPQAPRLENWRYHQTAGSSSMSRQGLSTVLNEGRILDYVRTHKIDHVELVALINDIIIPVVQRGMVCAH